MTLALRVYGASERRKRACPCGKRFLLSVPVGRPVSSKFILRAGRILQGHDYATRPKTTKSREREFGPIGPRTSLGESKISIEKHLYSALRLLRPGCPGKWTKPLQMEGRDARSRRLNFRKPRECISWRLARSSGARRLMAESEFRPFNGQGGGGGLAGRSPQFFGAVRARQWRGIGRN